MCVCVCVCVCVCLCLCLCVYGREKEREREREREREGLIFTGEPDAAVVSARRGIVRGRAARLEKSLATRCIAHTGEGKKVRGGELGDS
jgi:hypothetical protein